MSTFLIFFAGFVGMAAHWYKRWFRGQTGSTFAQYMSANTGNTILSFGAMVGACASIIATGAEVNPQLIATALLAGYTADSVMNKDKSE